MKKQLPTLAMWIAIVVGLSGCLLPPPPPVFGYGGGYETAPPPPP